MDFLTYQQEATKTRIYEPFGAGWVYPALGLTSEVGELTGKLKKHIRDKRPLDKRALAAELGDVLWYVAAICTDLGISLDMVAQGNVEKLADRAERGMIGGDGDRR